MDPPFGLALLVASLSNFIFVSISNFINFIILCNHSAIFSALYLQLNGRVNKEDILGMCSFQNKWVSERQLYLFVLLHHVIMK